MSSCYWEPLNSLSVCLYVCLYVCSSVELRALAELIGPYGMKHLSEGLMRQISCQVDEIKVTAHHHSPTCVHAHCTELLYMFALPSAKVLIMLCYLVHIIIVIITVCTLVQNCCKGDEPCQWNTTIFRPSEIRNPLTDRHETWHEWLRRGYHPTCKLWHFYPQGGRFCICVKLSSSLSIFLPPVTFLFLAHL